eukprot:76184_1
MGNQSSTPTKDATNTLNAYKGTIENLFEKKLAFQLYNPVYQQTLFVSDCDKIKPDFVLESHPHTFEERNTFYLKKIDGTDWEGYVLYHSKSGGYIFVSNDKSGPDHVVESHPYLKEQRNCFIFERQQDFLYTIFNAVYKEYLFVSNDTKGNKNENHIILSHPYLTEERNLFEIQLINASDDNNYDNDNEEKDIDMEKDHRIIKDTPVKENSDEEDNKLCIVCLENEKDYVIIPCGHICVCKECKEENYDDVDDATCPICRCNIEKIMKTYQ